MGDVDARSLMPVVVTNPKTPEVRDVEEGVLCWPMETPKQLIGTGRQSKLQSGLSWKQKLESSKSKCGQGASDIIRGY